MFTRSTKMEQVLEDIWVNFIGYSLHGNDEREYKDMEQVVLVIHLILALAIIGLVLIQRSEGGGLGIGGGGGGLGGLATPGGTASILTKVTGFCAFCFFATSLVLGILAGSNSSSKSIFDELDKETLEITVMDEEGAAASVDVPVAPKKPSVPVE